MYTLLNLYNGSKSTQRNGKSGRYSSSKKRRPKYVPPEELSRTERILREISNKILIISESSVNIMVSYWMPPLYYMLFMVYIRSRVIADSGIIRDLLEIPYTLYAMTNITGNFLMHKFKDVSLHAYAKNELPDKCLDKSSGDGLGVTFCKKCNMYQVEKSWHCKVCDKCVVGRDYHCFVFSQCVTRQNKRYYILGLFYASGALVYTTIYALLYQCQDEDFDTLRNIPILGNVLYTFVLIYSETLHLDKYCCWVTSFVLLINVFLFTIAFGMLATNLNCAIKGTTYWEMKARERRREICKQRVLKPLTTKHPWLQLVEELLGERWYLAFFCPFVNSPLPKRKLVDRASMNII